MAPSNTRSTAYRFLLLMGSISLLGDVVYEGARSVSGPFLASLGAGAGAVGLAAGLGELAGYGLRLLSGLAVDRTRRYWTITFLGYGMIAAIPLMAAAGRWEAATALLVAERIGKAVRNPARDAILASAASKVGRGWGFGIHEAMDQLGAFVGPLVFTASVAVTGGYRAGFVFLWVPVLLLFATMLRARAQVPDPESLEPDEAPRPGKGLGALYWRYALYSFLSVAGLAGFPLIAFHAKSAQILSDGHIPLLYAAAMAVDAVVALLVGRLYDRKGFAVLLLVPTLTVPVVAMVFSPSLPAIVAGALLWGGVMAVHETIMRAAIGEITPPGRRGSAYGLFNAVYGLAWFAGSAAMGALYAHSIGAVIAWSLSLEAVALPAFFWFKRARVNARR